MKVAIIKRRFAERSSGAAITSLPRSKRSCRVKLSAGKRSQTAWTSGSLPSSGFSLQSLALNPMSWASTSASDEIKPTFRSTGVGTEGRSVMSSRLSPVVNLPKAYWEWLRTTHATIGPRGLPGHRIQTPQVGHVVAAQDPRHSALGNTGVRGDPSFPPPMLGRASSTRCTSTAAVARGHVRGRDDRSYRPPSPSDRYRFTQR